MPSATYNVRPYSFDRWPYQGRIDAAITNWNGHSKVRVGTSSSSNSWIEVKWFADTWYGLYTKYWGITRGHHMRIQLNYRTIERDASNTANFVQSVMAHELGHSLSLAHNSVTSIMNQSRNRNTLYTRQTHDNNDVSSYY